jgi:hypothetical protein
VKATLQEFCKEHLVMTRLEHEDVIVTILKNNVPAGVAV